MQGVESYRIRSGVWIALIWVLLTSLSAGQVGRHPAAAIRWWGEPVDGALDDRGSGTLHFSSESMQITYTFQTNRCREAVYEMASRDFGRINQLLATNAQGLDWHGQRSSKDETGAGYPDTWTRSDGHAEAQWLDTKRQLIVRDTYKPTPTEGEEAFDEDIPTPDELAAHLATGSESSPSRPAPPPSAERPNRLPQLGDSRADTRRLLGPPPGIIVTGTREIWSFPWGEVWLEDDRVSRVHERIRRSD